MLPADRTVIRSGQARAETPSARGRERGQFGLPTAPELDLSEDIARYRICARPTACYRPEAGAARRFKVH